MRVRLLPMRCATVVALFALSPLGPGFRPLVAAPLEQCPPTTGLKIVVIAGEDAVNIIQQRTAVAPVVEVRDRNDLPVSGAVVTFAIRGGRATFSGARTLTLTTNAAGRAVAAGLTPTGTGAVQISASVAFQGQSALVAITQTNVLTAADAALAGGAGASGGGGAAAGAGAGGSGGGLSATTIGIIGAAAGGGALAAAKAAGSKNSPAALPPAQTPAGPTSSTHTGPYTGQLQLTFTAFHRGGPLTCVTTRALAGTLSLMLQQWPDGTVTGTAATRAVETIVATDCSQQQVGTGSTNVWDLPVTGTTQSLTFRGQQQVSGLNNVGGTQMKSDTLTFTGGLGSGALSGIMVFGVTGSGTNPDGTPGGVAFIFSGSANVSVTLR